MGGATALFLAFLAAFSPAAYAVDVQVSSFIDNPDPAVAGGTYTYDAVVENSAGDTASNVQVVIAVPAGATFISVTSAPVVGCAFNAGAGQVECNLGNLLGTALGTGGSPVNIQVTLQAPGTPGVINSSATVSTASADTNTANNTLGQTTTVQEGADLVVSKVGTPNPVSAGANVTYTLTASNNGPSAAQGVRVIDTLPPNVVFVSASGGGWSCGVSGQVVTCDRAAVTAVGAIPGLTIIGNVTGIGSGTITNTAEIRTFGPTGTSDPNPSNNTTTADVTVVPGADLTISKIASPSPAVAGQNVTFTLRPRNNGPNNASNVTVTDPLPSGFTFVSATGAGWACVNASGTVTCSRASYTVGAANDISLIALAPDNITVGQTGTSYSNTASINSAVTTDPNPGNNAGSVNVTVLPDGADLRTNKSKTPNPVAQGSNLTSVLSVTNNGPRTADRVRVIEQFPVGEDYIFASLSAPQWSCVYAAGSRTLTCDYTGALPLAVGATTGNVQFSAIASGTGVLTNQGCSGSASLGGVAANPPAVGDPNPGNDCGSASSTSTGTVADLTITKSATTANGDTTLAATENTITYTLTVTNRDDAAYPARGAATGIVVTDPIPGYISGSTAVAVTPAAGFTCSTGATVSCTQNGGDSLAVGASRSFTVMVTRPISDGTQTNTATVTSTQIGDPDSSNNSAQATVTVDPVADVTMVVKTVSPGTVQAGVNATYVMTFRNNGPSVAQNVQVDDVFTLPPGDAGFTVVSATPSKGSCLPFNVGTLTLTCNIGSMNNAEQQTITLIIRPDWQTGDPTRTFANTATISTTTFDDNAGNNSANAALTVNAAQVDLLVNKTDIVDPIGFDSGAPASNVITYRVRVVNGGPSLATGVAFADVLTPPTGKSITFLCDKDTQSGACNITPKCTNTGATVTGPATGNYTCTLGNVQAGETRDVFMDFRVDSAPALTGDTYNNLATVSSNEVDAISANNNEGETTTVRTRVDLAVTKTSSVSPVTLREPFDWIITVTNNGPGDSQQTDLVDTLPAGTALTGAVTYAKTVPAGSGTCSVAGSTISCAMGALNNSGVATVTVPVRVTSYPTGGTASNTASATTDQVDNTPANDSGTGSVTVTRSSLSGTVFRDRNNNGIKDGAPDNGIAGVTMTLTGTDAYGNAVNSSVVTDSNGNYTFTNLSPANGTGYTLTETQPGGYLDGIDTPGAAGGTSSGADAITGIALGGNQSATGYTFAEIRQPGISGFVYGDNNNDGVRQGGEIGISGVTVRLYRSSDNALIATTTTNGSGSYSFTGLNPDTYYVEETQPAGFFDGRDTVGQINGVTCAGCVTSSSGSVDRIANIDTTQGDDAANFNFGELVPSSLAGRVYLDRNGNGVIDGAETGVSGVTVNLTGTDDLGNTVSLTDTTNATGNYSFTNLRPGVYTITEPTQPPSTINGRTTAGSSGGAATVVAVTPSTISGINLAGNVNATANNFGELPLDGVISGRVYLDNNNDGLINGSDAGIGSITLNLTGADVNGTAVTQSVVTAADGSYSFSSLPPGTYTVTESSQPPGTLNGVTTAGSASGSSATPATTTPSAITIPLVAVSNSVNNNFGEILPSSLAGRVFNDGNNNGVLDGADAGIGSVTINLTGTSDLGQTVSLSTATAADGAYSFANLRPGTYTITEPTQPVGTLNGRTTAGSSGGTASAVTVTPSSISTITLPLNTASTGNDFAELVPALVSGRVFVDANNDGSFNGADSGLAGVTIQLVGTDDAGNAVSLSTVTAADGSYSFVNLRPGTYTLNQPAQPAGTVNGATTAGSAGGAATAVGSTPSQISNISLVPGTSSINNTFAELIPAQLSGRIFADNNNDGVFNGTDSGLGSVTVQLTGTDLDGNPISLSVITAVNGSYSFTNVRPGTYTVTEPTQPAGTINGITTPGTAGGAATAVGTTPSAISGVVLAQGTNASGNDFAELVTSSTISGRVYNDTNNNGVIDGADSGISGVTITLTGADINGNPVSVSTTTDPGGAYSFINLPPVNGAGYTVTQTTQPAGMLNGLTTPGSTGGTATAPPVATSVISVIPLGINQVSSANNFAELVPASLSGTVFVDNNNDGVINGADSGIGSIAITLSGTNDISAVSLNAVTDGSGNYSFTNLRPGVYTVTEQSVQPAGTANGITTAGSAGGAATPTGVTPSAVSNVTLNPGTVSSGNDFGEIPQAQLSGRVFADNNNDGLFNGTDNGLSGVVITLTGTDSDGNTVNVQATTLADGSYSFLNLRPGTYTVTENAQPPNTANGITTPGTTGGTATGVNVVPSAISGIVLGLGQSSTTNNFAELANTASIAGIVFSDSNNNGLFDAADTGLSGVTLVLTGTDSTGAMINRTTTTALDGRYSFTQLFSGTYTVTEPSQPANTLNGITRAGSTGGTATPVSTTPSAISNIILPPAQASIDNNFAEYIGATLRGTVWYDVGTQLRVLDSGDRRLPGWSVEVLDPVQQIIATATTDAAGTYSIANLIPGIEYRVQFRDPQSRVVFGTPVNGEAGTALYPCPSTLDVTQRSSCVHSGAALNDSGSYLGVILQPGDNLSEQSLPVDPSGVVYDSATRQPVPGSVVNLAPVGICPGYDPLLHVVNVGAGGYTVSGSSVSMTVGNDGFYQFLFAASAPPSCEFSLSVTPPATHAFISSVITPSALLNTLPAPGTTLVQPQATAPAPGDSTTYHLQVISGSATQNIIHNHIPLDPRSPTGILVAKTGSVAIVELGDSLQYTIHVKHVSGPALPNIDVYDTLPAGFRYIAGTARLGSTSVALADPIGAPGPALKFVLGPLAANQTLVLTYYVRAGVGAMQGDGINRAQAIWGVVRSNQASYRVRVSGGVFSTEACVLGKVFVDCNNNHVQDNEEPGIPGVRMYFEDGTYLISDVEGKYSICGISPRSHVLKADKTTLPRGSRLTTSSNRNLGDANSLFLDIKNGDLYRADFIEGTCSNTVLEQVKARRSQGEVRAPETEKKHSPALKFESKSLAAPQQATDTANQPVVVPRYPTLDVNSVISVTESELNVPVSQLPALQLKTDPSPGSAQMKESVDAGR